MPEERLNKIEERNKRFEQSAWKIMSTVALSVIVWYLSGINGELASLNKEIVSTNLKTNELMIRMLKLEETVEGVRNDVKESSKRIGTLERIAEGHERQLRSK